MNTQQADAYAAMYAALGQVAENAGRLEPELRSLVRAALAEADELPRPVPMDGRTPAELRLEGNLAGALILLRDREYARAERALTSAARDMQALVLLGPGGVDGIPVDYESSPNAPPPARARRSAYVPKGEYNPECCATCRGRWERQQAAADSPAGAGHAVEAERG